MPVDSATQDNASLREAIILAMHGKSWGLPKQGVLVKDGVVHLWGMIGSEEEKRAIHVAAENVPASPRTMTASARLPLAAPPTNM
ncbi:BON domain-containing protein [Trinickia dinghuensis]|uniref:BON domain-containing protein n=1 Tax=Trinickia dinghuensis TaxID=2291023 RepID=UPI0015F15DA1|nr:BON domain-containing protein [Trinickia dinghuensis]